MASYLSVSDFKLHELATCERSSYDLRLVLKAVLIAIKVFSWPNSITLVAR
jgi:hypothetical protein